MGFKRVTVLIGLLLFLLPGCARPVGVYPVEGPLAESGTVSRIEMTFDSFQFIDYKEYSFTLPGNWAKRGKIHVTLPDGEICQGEYAIYPFGHTIRLFSYAQYDTYFGSTTPPRLARYGQALATGDQGTVFQAEFYVTKSSRQGYGLARDNKDNVYKLLW